MELEYLLLDLIEAVAGCGAGETGASAGAGWEGPSAQQPLTRTVRRPVPALLNDPLKQALHSNKT